MNQIFDHEDVKGKKVRRIYLSFDELWISFAEGSFAWFRIDQGYENDASIELVQEAPNLLENRQAVVEIELATPEEIAALVKQKSALERGEQERIEKAQLARLLAKYPRQ